MLTLFRPELSQNVRNWVQHGVNPTKCVQNNRHCWRGGLIAHNISFRHQNNKSAKWPHSPGQITPLVGLFGRSADLFIMPKFEYKHLSHHFKFTSQQSKMYATPASVERVQKYVFDFKIYRFVIKAANLPHPPLQSMEWTGSILWIHNPVQSRRIWIGLDHTFTNSADSGLDWIRKYAMSIPYLETWGSFSLS